MQALINSFGLVISQLIKLTIGVGVLVFFWGLALFVFKSGDPNSHEEGRNKMVYGLIAIFVMFSVWGLVYFIQDALGLNLLYWGWDTMPKTGQLSV